MPEVYLFAAELAGAVEFALAGFAPAFISVT
jgi:hypothetical protein